jgi:hypothetical protein
MMNSFSRNDEVLFIKCLCWSCIQALLLHMRSSRHYCSDAQSFVDSQREKSTRQAQCSNSRFLNQQIEFALMRFYAQSRNADVMHVVELRIISE